MKNSDMPIMPVFTSDGLMSISTDNDENIYTGLTKREYAAIELMQGILAADTEKNLSMDRSIPIAVRIADELLNELEKES